MRNFAIIISLLLLSCQSSKQIFDSNRSINKINIEIKSSRTKLNLNGFSYIHPDSSILNIYGPLGINVGKVVSRYDSIWVVDIQNKRIYTAKYLYVSNRMYNFFAGKFSSNEQHLVCSLCSLFVSGLNCIETLGSSPLFDYKTYNSKNSTFIKGSFNSADGLYSIKIKLSDNNNNSSLSSSLGKYVNFENIYLNLK